MKPAPTPDEQDEARKREVEADALAAAGDGDAAIAIYQEIIASGHADAVTWGHLGDAYGAQEAYVQARDAYREALALAPEEPALHVNIARPLYLLGEAEAAASHLEYAIPRLNDRTALENLAAIAPGIPGYDAGRILVIRRAFGMALSYPEKHPAACLAEARENPPERPSPARRPPRAPGEPMRIGYLSAHFARPAYMGPVWALINNHDRARFRIYLLSDAPGPETFPGYAPIDADTIVDVAAASDAQVAAFIAAQGIDILVDLSGYSFRPRLTLFARRVAPVVLAWFNMYATSGLPAIDYLVGDDHVVRPGEEADYSETVLRLPQSYLSFAPFEGRPPVAPPPCTGGTPFTFGSLVSLYKITAPVLDAWCALLAGAHAARLLIANADLKSPHHRAWFLERFRERGIDPARLILRDPAAHNAFLRYYDEIDLALDSFPYSGGTTTMEALWQGVPVLTQAGDYWAARTTGSILDSTHLGEFCCRDVAHYVARGVELATDPRTPDHLARLRDSMRAALCGSAALDGASLARHMEAIYEAL